MSSKLKLVSWNVNGVRACSAKGGLDELLRTEPDIVCLQELKADRAQVERQLGHILGYELHVNPASRPGYAGVAVLTRRRSCGMNSKLGLARFDEEGRFLELDLGELRVVNVYMPHGGRKQEHMGHKLASYDRLLTHMHSRRSAPAVLLGDMNIAFAELDLARPRQNRNNTMFRSEERSRLAGLVESGFVDSFRQLHPERIQYSWWPWLADARARNVGWRIDYAFVSAALAARIRSAFILDQVRGSDHCPIGLELELR